MDFLIRLKRTIDGCGAYPRCRRIPRPGCRRTVSPRFGINRYNVPPFKKSNAACNIDSAPIFSAPSSKKNLGE